MKGFLRLGRRQREFTLAAVFGAITTALALVLVFAFKASPLVWAVPSVLGASRGMISAGIMRDVASKSEVHK